MDPLILEATEYSPEIVLDKQKNIFFISKRSLHENAMGFFKPVLEWLENYINNPNEETVFEFKLEYYNTASAKQIAKLFLILEKLAKQKKVLIKWHYNKEDTDMLSSGKRYSKLIKLDFEFIEEV